MFIKLSFGLTLLFLVSCQNSAEKKVENTTEPSNSPNIKKIQSIVDYMNNNESDFTVANSLFYQHNDGSTEEVFAYLNKKQEIVKIEEKFKEGENGNSGVRFFYFDAGKKIASEERFIDMDQKKSQFRERFSFYKPEGNVILTKERVAPFEEDLAKMEFSQVAHFDCSTEMAENVLNQKGLFATTFQGFASDGPIDYLIVGGPGKSGFASALAIQYADEVVNQLKANEKSMINTPLLVEFEKMMDERKLEFQVLTRVQINK